MGAAVAGLSASATALVLDAGSSEQPERTEEPRPEPTSSMFRRTMTTTSTMPTPSIVLTNALDLRAAFREASQELVGGGLPSAAAEDFVAEYHAAEEAHQLALYYGDSRSTLADPYAYAEDYIRRNYSTEVGGWAMAKADQCFREMVGLSDGDCGDARGGPTSSTTSTTRPRFGATTTTAGY